MRRPERRGGRRGGRVIAAPLGLALALLAGCAEAPWSGGGQITVDTLPGGAVQVTSPLEGTWGDDEGWWLEEELRIGTSQGDGPELFANIAALAVDDPGRILVLDQQARELRIFGPDGEHLRTIGRSGSGPGEFTNPVGLAVHPHEGTIWVVDPGNARYSVFAPEGDLLATHPRPVGYFAWPWPGGFTHEGELYDVVAGGLLHVSAAGEPGDTVWVPEHDTPTVRVADPDGTMRMSLIPPFSPRRHWRFDPTGHLWSGVSDGFHFTGQTLGGDTVRIVRRDHEPVAVTRAEADSLREQSEELIARNAGPNAQVDGDLRAPPNKPAFETFLVDDEGGLWVEPSRAMDDPVRQLHVFDPAGAYLGPVEADPGLRLVNVRPVFRDRALYAVVTDELDVPHVVRYRIHSP